MDQLVAEEPDHTLGAQHDQRGDPERDAQQQRQRLCTEQRGQRIPGDRRQPLQNAGQYDTAAESHPGVRQLTGARPWPPGRKLGDDYCA